MLTMLYSLLQEFIKRVFSIERNEIKSTDLTYYGHSFGDENHIGWKRRVTLKTEISGVVQQVDAVATQRSPVDENKKSLWSSEVGFLKKLQHKNILRCYGYNVTSTLTGQKLTIITEYLPRGSLFKYLKNSNTPSFTANPELVTTRSKSNSVPR